MQIMARLPKQIQLQLQQPMQQLQQQRQQQPDRRGNQHLLAPQQAQLQPAENGGQQQQLQQHTSLGQERLLTSQAAQQQQLLVLQHSMGQMLVEACTSAGVSLEAFLGSPREQQVVTLLKHLQLPLGPSTVAAVLAPGQQQQPHNDQQQQHPALHQQQQQRAQHQPHPQSQHPQPPGPAVVSEAAPPGSAPVEPGAADDTDTADVPHSPSTPAKQKVSELVALEAAAAAAAERAMANLGPPKGSSPSRVSTPDLNLDH